MRRPLGVVLLLGVIGTFCIAIPGAASGAEAPTVILSPSIAAGYATARLSGSVDPHGEEATVYAEYATEASGPFSYQFVQTIPAGTAGSTPISAEVTGLRASTQYFFRLDAEVASTGETYSAEPYPTATTGSVGSPTVSIETPRESGGGHAVFSGHIDPNAPEPAPASPEVEAGFEVHWHFECSPECPGLEGTVAADDSSNSVEVEATELLPGTSYEVSLVARNAGGAETAGPVTFATPAAVPAVDSTGFSAVTPTAATLEASVRPDGAATTVHFDYLSETDYLADGETFGAGTQSTPESESIGSDATDHAVSASISGLSPLTTYFFRGVATNSAGAPVAGPTKSFTTYAEQGSGLADGRAYEQATPIDKNGGDPQLTSGTVQAADEGTEGLGGASISYYSLTGIPGGEGAQNYPMYLASRAAAGWSNQGLLPPASATEPVGQVLGWSEDLSRAYDWSSSVSYEPGTLYLRENATRTLQTIVEGARSPHIAGESSGGSALAFESTSALPGTDGRESASNVYLWDRASGHVYLASVLNDGEAPEEGAFAGPYDWWEENTHEGGSAQKYYTEAGHVLSSGGSRVFFTETGSGRLYMRVNPTRPQSEMEGEKCLEEDMACTILVSAPEAGVVDPEGEEPAAFIAASRDGSKVFFTSSGKLTADSTTGPVDEGSDLYRYDAVSGELLDLTPDENSADPAGAGVKGVLGLSEDGSYVYFVAAGALPGSGAPPSTCSGAAAGVGGTCNLYVWHEDPVTHDRSTRFIAQLEPGFGSELEDDYEDWKPGEIGSNEGEDPKTARVTPDGLTLLFRSRAQLSTYDNEGVPELFRYRVGASPDLLCVSCDPTGSRPIGEAQLQKMPYLQQVLNPQRPVLSRNLSTDGDRVFFQTPDSLVASDTNAEHGCPLIHEGIEFYYSCTDVYEWESDGTGSCRSQSQDGGCLYLISPGDQPVPAFFADASADGDDAFFATRQRLVGQDRDELRDLYDARAGGGLASQNPSPTTSCADEASCRPSATTPPPSGASPGSVTGSGPGNVEPRHPRHKRHHRHRRSHHRRHRRHSGGRGLQRRPGDRGDRGGKR